MLVIAAWNVLPRLALKDRHPWLRLPDIAVEAGYYNLRLAAAALAVGCLLLTVRCWVRMGRSWSIAALPDEKRPLVTGELYALVRHPIYALSILLMIATMVVVPTPFMLLCGLAHLVFMSLKARSEEQTLLAIHGRDYAEYCHRTGRFFPRLGQRLRAFE